jgi:hypothetical protein
MPATLLMPKGDHSMWDAAVLDRRVVMKVGSLFWF